MAKRGLQVFGQALLLAICLFLAAGRLDWAWAWAYLGLGAGIILLNVLVVPPGVAAERGRPRKESVEGWDRVLMVPFALAVYSVPVVAGLDVRHGRTAPVDWPVHVAGLVLIALGQGLFTWAMRANRFFSTVVRLQRDRGHAAATDGPYRVVRHPGYAGYVVSLFATGPALGSWWALAPAGIAACLLIVRTALEDRMLRRDLVGYEAYARRVRYRLLPGLW
jgi:protein-S-isoprenylcysteine O-methyltransferase Ste14